ncbi:MAG: relaxase/mobilization nuclease domain-containing protein [Hyphomicrobiales bacterium]|nr:relaxase/mobilization nuclease domain-containing protein [Hyphomicrobiales bacterium]
MIGKVPDQGRSFRGVVAYLLHGKKGEPAPDRVAFAATRNLMVEDPEKAARLMRATAAKSARVKTPVYHYVVSWRRDEAPSDEVMRQVADVTCADLGLAKHQTLYVGHRDTEHAHVHVVVNRVHPETGKAWRNAHDYRRIETSLRRQAEAMGLDYVPGRHNDPERFYGQNRKPAAKEQQRAKRLGKPAQARWSREKIAAARPALRDAFTDAQSWAELARRLAGPGLTLAAKGQGMVIADAGGAMKLSDLGREVRLKDLETRFGGLFADFDREREADRAADRREAREAYADAAAGAEMSYYLYRMGLADRDEVERAAQAKRAAREVKDADRPVIDRLAEAALKPAREPRRQSPEPEDSPARRRSRGRGR